MKMNKLFIITLLFVTAIISAQVTPANEVSPYSGTGDSEMYKGFVLLNASDADLDLTKSNLASPTFTGTVTIPTLAATSSTLTDATISDDATVGDSLTVTGILYPNGGISQTSTVLEITTIVTIDSTKLVGAAAGDLAHVDGAILIAAPSSAYVLEFVSALFIYDYATATFGGGANDVVVQVGAASSQVTVSGAITSANLLTAAGDKIIQLGAIATELVPLVGGAISINGTVLTNPGTAAGLLRVHVTYRKHTTGL